MSARFTLIASLAAVALGASSAAQAQYTIKLGGAHINPHATSEPLRGGVAVPVAVGEGGDSQPTRQRRTGVNEARRYRSLHKK